MIKLVISISLASLEQTMPFSKAFIRQTWPLLLVTVILGQSGKPAVAQDNPKGGSTSSAAQPVTGTGSDPGGSTSTDTSVKIGPATRPVNEKILPLIKEGYLDLSKGSYDKAIKVLKKALSLDKEAISARRYLAYALIQTGHAQEALAQMMTVSKLVPPNAFDFYLFAASYYAAGGVKEARDCYNEALRQNPGYDAARAGLVKTLAHEHNFEEALSNVQQGLQLTKDEAVKKYYTSLGKAVSEAQSYQQQAANGSMMPGNITSQSSQTGGDSVKSQPLIIR
jgi:tetratricopeptide (TPR) repeat protein